MDLSLQVLALVSYSICMRVRVRVGVCGERERERVRENERKSERTRERKRDGPSLLSESIQLIHFNASSSLSVDLGALCHTEMWSSQRGIAQCSSCPSQPQQGPGEPLQLGSHVGTPLRACLRRPIKSP